MTEAERKMWFILRDLDRPQAHFRRQVRIGNFFADFLSHSLKLIVEVDGSQHYEPRGLSRDAFRTAFLNGQGFQVLRFDNSDVLTNPRGCADKILSVIAGITPTPSPPHKGEGQKRMKIRLSPAKGKAKESGNTNA